MTQVTRRGFVRRLSAAAFLSSKYLAAQGRPQLPVFSDVRDKTRIGFVCNTSRTPEKYLIETMGGGVALFDYDGDGRLDIFFVNGAALKPHMTATEMPDKSDPKFWNRLYHNNGDGTFTDVTGRAGVKGHSYGQGVAVGDYDNDGRPDLFVTNYGRNILYHNNGDGTFTDVTDKAGVAGGGWSVGACFVDYDRDGKLDLMVVRYLDWDLQKNPWCGDASRNFRAYCHPSVFKPATYILYHNNGDGTFTDVTVASGFAAHPGNGLGVDINDFDHDGWPDILVANDTLPQQLFRNNHDGTFTEVGERSGLAFDEDGRTFSGMGVSFEDYNNDGWPDVFIGDLADQKYALYKAFGDGKTFEYVTNTSGVGGISMLHSAWGTKFFDYDNDGLKDLLVAQSHVMDNIEQTQPSVHYREPLLLMRNVDGRFQDVSAVSGDPFRRAVVARGAAFGDIDNDGFLDCVVNCLDGPPMILRNHGNGNHWVSIDTTGTVSNRDGIGAKIHVVTPSGKHQYAMVDTAGSYLSASDKRVHFGLGEEKQIKVLEISWPSGIQQRLENIAADQFLHVKEPDQAPGK